MATVHPRGKNGRAQTRPATQSPRPQHLEALAMANYVRRRTAEIRRAIKAGDVSLVDAIRGTISDGDADELIARRPIRETLTAGHRIGDRVARTITDAAGIPADLALRGLSDARRQQLADVVRHVAPWVEARR